MLDLELGIPFGDAVTLVVGGENVLGTYPDVNRFGADTVGNQYGQFSPFGFNGAYYYTAPQLPVGRHVRGGLPVGSRAGAVVPSIYSSARTELD